MAKICLIGDTHFGARNDSVQFDVFFKKFYDEVFFPYLDQHQIKTVFHMGDVFDRRKFINFSILKSCKEYFFEQLRTRDIDMTVVLGNHDTYYKNTNDVNSLDLLLREYQNIKIVEQPTTEEVGGCTFTFAPWMCADNYDEVMNVLKIPSEICIGHFEIDGFDMFRGVKNDGGMNRNVLDQFEAVFTGHFHHRSSQDNIYYLGSPYGFTWSDYDDPRGFHIFDTVTRGLTFIENPFAMFHKIYYDDRKDMKVDFSQYRRACVKLVVTHKTDFPKFDKFIESLYNNEVLELTIYEDFSEFESESMGETTNIEDTMTLLSEFVDQTETIQDKDKLKSLLKTLYVEAQHLEL